MLDREKVKSLITNVRLSPLQKTRIMKLAAERQWSVSHMIQFIIDEYCDKLFIKDSEEFK